MKNILIIGAGITGITLAERFASKGFGVEVIEKRNHIGGNCYDSRDKNGILIHKYGPHVFHTNYKEVWNYLSSFTDWIHYEHKVLSYIDKKYVPIPFNLNTLRKLLPERAEKLEKKLIEKFGYNNKISILKLRKTKNKELKQLAEFIYEKVFLNYTKKQWGVSPDELDFLIISRVPIITSLDNRYFHDKYQGLPREGYTKMFEKMVDRENINIRLRKSWKRTKNKKNFDLIFFTAPIDEFFNYKYGKLKYRHFQLKLKTFHQKSYQLSSVINYPNNYNFTRKTEFKKFYTNNKSKNTIVGIEYPGEKGFIGWPFLDKKNKEKFKKYQFEAKKIKNIYFVGRLGEFKYYNMDEAIKNSLILYNKIIYGRKRK